MSCYASTSQYSLYVPFSADSRQHKPAMKFWLHTIIWVVAFAAIDFPGPRQVRVISPGVVRWTASVSSTENATEYRGM